MDDAAIKQHLNSAAAALKAGDPARALKQVATVITARPDVGPAYYLLGGARAALGQTDEAKSAFQRALGFAPDFVPARIALANLHEQTGDLADAVAILDAHPGAPVADLLVHSAGLHMKLKEYDRAQTLCDRLLRLAPDDSRAMVLKGRIYIETSKYLQAEQMLTDATRKFPNSASAYFYLARAHTAMGKTRPARDALGAAAKLLPNAPSIMQEQARAAYFDGDAASALRLLEDAIAREPQNPSLHRDISQICYMKEDGDHLRSFREYLAKSPFDIGMLAMYAGAARAGEHPEAALPQLNAAINAGVDHALLWDARAQIHILLDEYQQAEADTDRAGTAPGLEHSTELNRCSAYLSVGLPEKALPIATTLVENAPLDQLAIAYRLTAMCALDDPAADEFIDPDVLTGQRAIDCPEGFDSLEDFNLALKNRLLELHGAVREPIDQSLRGGTQTELFPIIGEDPLIGKLTERLLLNVRRFAEGLPRKEGHPFLGAIPDEFNFSGIWSVCLRDGGHHASHVHPEGWLSSAYYVSLPPPAKNISSGEGALNIGKPPMKALWDKLPGRPAPPREGHLTLFPSYLWHGTEPFHSAEPRITVAFDIAPRHD